MADAYKRLIETQTQAHAHHQEADLPCCSAQQRARNVWPTSPHSSCFSLIVEHASTGGAGFLSSEGLTSSIRDPLCHGQAVLSAVLHLVPALVQMDLKIWYSVAFVRACFCKHDLHSTRQSRSTGNAKQVQVARPLSCAGPHFPLDPMSTVCWAPHIHKVGVRETCR